MRSLAATLLSLVFLLGAAGVQAGSPEDLRRGMKMPEVEAMLGEPQQKRPAVGQPPISSWIYDGFAVYFEYDLLLHMVRTNRACPLCKPGETAPAQD